MNNIRTTNLRFNLNKDLHRRAWEYLQSMDKQRFKSYSHAVAVALVDYFDRYHRALDDPYMETREREERFVDQIISAVEKAMDKALPIYLAGCMTGLAQFAPGAVATMGKSIENEAEPDVDWDFLGE